MSLKIIQTLWLPENQLPIFSHSCGWLSPEFNWMSWCLSVLQLRKYYDNVELYANRPAIEALVNILKLPYTKVHEIPDVDIPPGAWALPKLMTYNSQREPFLHVDGDVYIFEPFRDALLGSDIISQNAEQGFDKYQQTLNDVRENCRDVDSIFLLNPGDLHYPGVTYNAGILGGTDLSFFKQYTATAITFVLNNREFFQSTESSSARCMLFEQWLMSALAKRENRRIATLLPDVIDSNNYPGLADFLNPVNPYLHFMGLTKSNRYALKQMMNFVRMVYPSYYYKVLRLCMDSGVKLDYQLYHTPALNPRCFDDDYFLKLVDGYTDDRMITTDLKWRHFYAKDVHAFNQVRRFNGHDGQSKRKVLLSLNRDVTYALEDEQSPHLIIHDTFSMDTLAIPLEQLEAVIIDKLTDRTLHVDGIMDLLREHFDEEDYLLNKEILFNMVIDKIGRLILVGALSLREN